MSRARILADFGGVTSNATELNLLDGQTDIASQAELDAVNTENEADADKIQTNLALLAFKTSVNGSLAKYDLQDQIVDEYVDATGVNAGDSTNETLSGGAYSGVTLGLGSTITKHFVTDNPSWSIATGSIIDKMIVIAAGGAGGNRDNAGSNNAGGGGGGGGFVALVNYTVPAGITSANVSIGLGGGDGGAEQKGLDGGNTSIVFGNSLTVTSTGGVGGSPTGGTAGGGVGGSGSISGTSGSPQNIILSGGTGGNAVGAGTGLIGNAGSNATLISTQYYAPGGGGGGGGANIGGGGGAGNASSYTGGGGGAGGDGNTENAGPAPGAGYGTAGEGGSTDGAEDAGYQTIDSVNVYGGIGTIHGGNFPGGERAQNNAGGGGIFGGGGGGIGDGGTGETSAHGAQGYVRVEYRPMETTGYNDLILQSSDTTAEAAPTKADIVMLIEDVAGTASIDISSGNIKAYISMYETGGTKTWTQATLVDEGNWGANKRILSAHDVTLSGTSGTQMAYKITTHTQSASIDTRIHATSIGWR